MTLSSLFQAKEDLLVLIDLQERLLPAIQQGEAVARRSVFLAQVASALEVPTLVTEHCAERIGGSVPPLRTLDLPTVAKRHFGAMETAAFREALPPDRRRVILAGTEAHVCVYQTAVGLLEAGWAVALAVDACGSGLASDRETALADLARRGCRLATTEQVAFEWLSHADHPAFRTVLALLKTARH